MKNDTKMSAKMLIFGLSIFVVGAVLSYGLIMFGGGAMMVAAVLPPSGGEDDPL